MHQAYPYEDMPVFFVEYDIECAAVGMPAIG